MIFGRLPLDQAEGAILAHAVIVNADERLRKGHVLTLSDIASLAAAGIITVLAAKLDETDIGENAAAAAIAAPLCGGNVTVKAPFTGRTNLFASKDGIFTVDEDIINSINSLHESITIATIENHEKVEAGQMVATVKIIPFAAQQKNVSAALNILGDAEKSSALQISPFIKQKIGVISTILPGTKERIIRKSEEILSDRLSHCGNTIDIRQTVSHDEQALKLALESLMDQKCDVILIFGASAITDRLDVIPMAISLTGGNIDHFGMPVDPGNLMLLGHNGPISIIGLPGCARSPKLNGFDWVLQRLLANIPVTPSDIMNMGVGGLLKEISSRPQPRSRPVSDKTGNAPKSVAILILAAGQSRRMGPKNKLLAEIDGQPMADITAEQALGSKAEAVFAVIGHEKEKTNEIFENKGIKTFFNEQYEEGLSSSLKTGFRELADNYDGILICLADMPFVTTALLDQLIDAFDIEEGRAIIVPAVDGKRGNPVLIASSFKADILALTGDIGAKPIITENEHVVFNLDIENDSIFRDIDTPESLIHLQRKSELE